ncbi:MAG: 3-isopropylmalate dehydratase large subunit [Mucispirillum sp.]|nr:3-isopropylmalate dehydratase large subunit [Mucispirillum sp.]
MGKNLFQKVWERHEVGKLSGGQSQLFIDLHLLHEVTSPQAFAMIREMGLKVAYPERTFATHDHIIPTDDISRPFKDNLAEEMMAAIEKNTSDFGIRLFGVKDNRYGVIHIVGPEEGLTQPGMTVACGDSHTATHGAFGAVAFGVGTSQVRDILATQTMSIAPFKVRRIELSGKMNKGVYSKDLILAVIAKLGVNGGLGYAYEFGGSAVDAMSMEARMTICNMAIEGGARVGYMNPDETTFNYIKGKPYAPEGASWEKALNYWKEIISDKDAHYDDKVQFDVNSVTPMVTWGITPEMAVGIDEKIPEPKNDIMREALDYMKFKAGNPIKGTKIDVAFLGSCTNGRIEDFRIAAEVVKGRKVAKHVKALAVPGSVIVKEQAEKEGLDEIFKSAGFEWREPGCSMCLAMNPDKLAGEQISASTSNRNFKGRQGSASGRTILLSPAMAAAAAIEGAITDVRNMI